MLLAATTKLLPRLTNLKQIWFVHTTLQIKQLLQQRHILHYIDQPSDGNLFEICLGEPVVERGPYYLSVPNKKNAVHMHMM